MAHKIADPEAHQMMVKARTTMLLTQGQEFWATLAMGLPLVEDPGCGTAWTDASVIGYDPKYIRSLTPSQRVGLIAHEIGHVSDKHPLRLGTRDLELANRAGDYRINGGLIKAKFDLPDGGLIDRRFDGLSFEEIYYILDQERKKQQQKDEDDERDNKSAPDGDNGDSEDEPGDDGEEGDQGGAGESDRRDGDGAPDEAGDGEAGPEGERDGGGEADAEADGGAPGDDAPPTDGGDSGAGDGDAEAGGGGGDQDGPDGADPGDNDLGHATPDPGRCGGFRPAKAATEAERADLTAMLDVEIRQAIAVATKVAEGVPSGLQSLVDEIREPKQDWRSILRAFVDPSQRKDYSWSRPNRRYSTSPFVLPGFASDGVSHIGIAVDVSGSINREALMRFRGEIQLALDDGFVDKVTVVYFDTKIVEVQTYDAGDQLKLTVTTMGSAELYRLAFDWFKQNEPDVVCCLVFTDMVVVAGVDESYGTEPPFPVLFCAYGNPIDLKHWIPLAPFGEVITLND